VGRNDEAVWYKQEAEARIAQKGELIPDLDQRQRYLDFTRDLLSNHC
jgi:hypothetical protein